jgi:hypothetical protein
MRFYYLPILLLFDDFACNSKPQNENVAVNSSPSVSSPPQAAVEDYWRKNEAVFVHK